MRGVRHSLRKATILSLQSDVSSWPPRIGRMKRTLDMIARSQVYELTFEKSACPGILSRYYRPPSILSS